MLTFQNNVIKIIGNKLTLYNAKYTIRGCMKGFVYLN
jgi:hypothetical protein